MKNIKFLIALSILLSSCSSTNPPELERSGFRVSVTSNGKPVKDYTQTLIYRIEISESELSKVFGKSDEDERYKKLLKRKESSTNSSIGLEVGEEGIEKLGLESGDVVISIGTMKIQDIQDFWHLKETIEIDKSAELTIMRNGRANKVLYFLNE